MIVEETKKVNSIRVAQLRLGVQTHDIVNELTPYTCN